MGAKDITLLRNYIQNTGKRAIWMLGTENTFLLTISSIYQVGMVLILMHTIKMEMAMEIL